MASLQQLIMEKLDLKTARDLGASGGGCISNSRRFATDIGDLFVKTYEKEKVFIFFNSLGEVTATPQSLATAYSKLFVLNGKTRPEMGVVGR